MKRLVFYIIAFLFTVICISSLDKSGSAADSRLAAGYGKLQWGVSVSAAREGVKGKIKYTDDKTVIVSSDGNIEYTYGFLYVDPQYTEAVKEEAGAEKNVQEKEGTLFFVVVKFPYLALEDVRKKMTASYGEPSSENISKNQGIIAWDSASTLCIMWIDNYENKPFCSRITYLAKDAAKKLDEYQNQIFNAREIKVIKSLNP